MYSIDGSSHLEHTMNKIIQTQLPSKSQGHGQGQGQRQGKGQGRAGGSGSTRALLSSRPEGGGSYTESTPTSTTPTPTTPREEGKITMAEGTNTPYSHLNNDPPPPNTPPPPPDHLSAPPLNLYTALTTRAEKLGLPPPRYGVNR